MLKGVFKIQLLTINIQNFSTHGGRKYTEVVNLGGFALRFMLFSIFISESLQDEKNGPLQQSHSSGYVALPGEYKILSPDLLNMSFFPLQIIRDRGYLGYTGKFIE